MGKMDCVKARRLGLWTHYTFTPKNVQPLQRMAAILLRRSSIVWNLEASSSNRIICGVSRGRSAFTDAGGQAETYLHIKNRVRHDINGVPCPRTYSEVHLSRLWGDTSWGLEPMCQACPATERIMQLRPGGIHQLGPSTPHNGFANLVARVPRPIHARTQDPVSGLQEFIVDDALRRIILVARKVISSPFGFSARPSIGRKMTLWRESNHEIWRERGGHIARDSMA
ncbi:hypothetical protein C8R44DRAFT_731540 [Mycena epipterygia]|nr:hypothetical protein C8R44DRAFT_731540 [Mycena epipterygia]